MTILTCPDQRRYEATVVDLSGCGLRLRMPASVKLGAAVKVEAEDMLLLGEVCRSTEEHGAWMVALELCHSLVGLPELEQLNRALCMETEDSPARYPVKQVG